MPRKVFVAGEILTAADVNTNLMDQAVMVFDDSTARGSAIPSPSEGMVTYLKDVNQVQAYDGSAFTPVGKIVDVKHVTKTDTQATSAAQGTVTGISGLSITHAVSNSSNKVFLLGNVSRAGGAGRAASISLRQDSNLIEIGAAAGSRTRVGAGSYTGDFNDALVMVSVAALYSPGNTTSIVYDVAMHHTESGTSTTYVNRSLSDTDTAAVMRSASTLTLMEVAG